MSWIQLAGWQYCDWRGWACILSFPCADSKINETDLNFKLSGYNMLGYNRYGNGYNFTTIMHEIDVQGHHLEFNLECNTWSQDIPYRYSLTNITSLLAQHIWKLNPETKAIVQAYNSLFDIPLGNKYVGVQIRLTDKRGDMGSATWDFLSNNSAIAATVVPYMDEEAIEHVYVSTDDCTIVENLEKEFQQLSSPKALKFSTACANPLNYVIKPLWSLVSEIEMLRGSELFFSTLYSGLNRHIHRLRYPDHHKSINFMSANFTMDVNNLADFGNCWHGDVLC